MTNPLYTISTLPADDQAAIREFDDRYIAAIGAAPPATWSDLGDLIPASSPFVTYPISSMSLKYKQTEGESRFKTLLASSFDIKAQEFDVGVQAKLLDLLTQVFAYRNWQAGPARMMIAEGNHRNRSLVTLLEDAVNQKWGSTAKPIDGANFFSTTHLSNFADSLSTTWGNYQASPKDVVSIANIQAEVTAMQGVLDENSEVLGVDPDTILVPTAKYEPLKNLLAKELILENGTGSAATNNPFKGRFNVVHVPQLTDADDWYLVDSKLKSSAGLPPWISLRYTVPNPSLELRYYDESTDFFKDTGNIKVSSHIWYGFSMGFPHGIRLVKGA